MASHLSISQLKAECAARGLSTVGMLEKSEFVAALEEYTQRTPSPAEAHAAALEAVGLSRAQSHVVEVQMSFTTNRPEVLSVRCEACSRDGPTLMMGSKCLRAAYCSSACQQDHWSAHKVACKVDRGDTREVNSVYYIDHSCRHGGPNPQTNPALLASLSEVIDRVVARLDNTTSPSGEIGLWVSVGRTATIHPQLHRALRSCGVDAFVDNNYNIARMFCRLSAFCEQYTIGGEEFLVALDGGQAVVSPKGLTCLLDLTASVRQSIPRTGMLAMLRAPMNCMCLRPFQLPSSPPPSEGKEEPAGMN